MFAIIFSTLIYQQIYLRHPCFNVSSICEHMGIALIYNCPMYGEFPSDAWLKMNAREEKILTVKMPCIKRKSFIIYKLLHFG